MSPMKMMQAFFSGKQSGCDPDKMMELMSGFCCAPHDADEKADKDGANESKQPAGGCS
ncbi:MAG: hypothetical protein OEZ55_14630 [Nitrospinota bacterium]|nr:hypothetical protein [Nitrospinota bacterium]